MANDVNAARCRRELTRMERHRVYAPNQAAIAALELSSAMAVALTRRFGRAFADEVLGELRLRSEALANSSFEDQCTGRIIDDIASWHMWDEGSDPGANQDRSLTH